MAISRVFLVVLMGLLTHTGLAQCNYTLDMYSNLSRSNRHRI